MAAILNMANVAGSASQIGSGLVNKFKVAAGMQQEQEKGMLQAVDDAVTLTWKQRAIGFGICFGIGLLLSIISIPMLWTLKLTQFAIFYTLGSIVSVFSTMFLMGPVNQCKKMLDQGRILATIVYFVAIIVTLIVAFKTHNPGLCILCLIIQFLALIWYCFTWIPGGQLFLKSMLMRAGG